MLTKSVEIAAELVAAVSEGETINGRFKLGDYAAHSEISGAWLQQIGSKLKRAGILGATRGPGGGYYIQKEVVSMADIAKAVTTCDVEELNGKYIQSAMKALESVVVAKAQ